jgi:UDP-glucuronate 4-epimerase
LGRILVTGAAGFIGSHVCEALLARGDDVVGLDSFDAYYSPGRKRANVAEVERAASPGRFTLVEGDVRDGPLLERLVLELGIRAIAHLAGLAGVRASVLRPHDYVDVNVGGTLHVLEAARQGRVENVVFVSTSSAYGAAPPPFVESDAADRPLAPYAATKRAGELLCHSHHHVHGLSCTVVRLFTAYGPRNRPDMMAYKVLDSIFTGREIPLYAGGAMLRDWTFVEDIARGIVLALDRPLGYEVVNLGRGEPVEVIDFIRLLEELAGREACLVPAPRLGSDSPATGADIGKARRLLGFDPRVDLREGAGRLYRWYVQHVAAGAEQHVGAHAP